jgi:hypothetical protein
MRPRRRWPLTLLAWVLVGGLIMAAAAPSDQRSNARPPQLVTPLHGQAIPAAKQATQLTVGDRHVRLLNADGLASDRLVSRVAANIGAAVGMVEEFWGTDWSRDISVVFAGTDEEFRGAAGGGPTSQWADIAAVTVADRVDPVRRLAVGQRIVFAPGAAGMSDSALRIVLSHELFHYAARADTVLDAPRWLTEGVADFVARPKTAVPADALPVPLMLPSDADLDTPGPQRSLAYDRAWWFARFVADTYGAPKLRDLYLATCGVRHADVPTAIHDVLGDDTAIVLVRWHQWTTR